MSLSLNQVEEILKLRSNELIAPEIAKRQTEAIRKAYNYLTASDDHNVVYIADEVGLGKTYIALGIVALLRHISCEDSTAKTCIIVPKANLQEKWKREAIGFFANNYKGDKKHKEVDIRLKVENKPINEMFTFRMTSFSSLYRHSNSQKQKLIEMKGRLADNDFCCSFLINLYNNGYFNQDKEDTLRKVFAYLLNIAIGKLDIIVIDEAHNYKKGLGTSLRNDITAYFLGAKKDKTILELFPLLKEKINFPLAKKVICLSATPKDRDLKEIGNQLDCFLDKNCLQNISRENFLPTLQTFMMRGNMDYKIQDKKVSRHACRHEHRIGNIKKEEISKPLIVEDDFTGAFWQLLQYQSIKYLSAKDGAKFEMGMLAGFETYQLDSNQAILTKAVDVDAEDELDELAEYDQTANKEDSKSQDKLVIENIVKSFKEKFDDLPPHPKQTPLEQELLDKMSNQEKGLVFVRRVNSASEMTGRLLREYEKLEYKRIKTLKGKYAKYVLSTQVKSMLVEFEKKEKKPEILKFINTKLANKIQLDFIKEDNKEDFLWFAYMHDEHIQEEVDNLIGKERLHIRFIENLKKLQGKWEEETKENEENRLSYWEEYQHINEYDTKYFFSQYFSKGKNGFNYRAKMSKQKLFDTDWDMEEVNNLFLNRLLRELCSIEYDYWIQKRSANKKEEEFELLKEILSGVFRNGSGLLAGFLAASYRKTKNEKSKFSENLLELLKPNAPFEYICKEVKQILIDFDLIVNANFKKKELISRVFRGLSPVIGRTGQSGNDRSIVAAQFRMPGYPYVLIATDIFKEGEDLHTYCQNVYHYGIAWNPSDMEQRNGRIDRINSLSYRKLTDSGSNIFENKIHVFYPYLQQSVEVNQVYQLFRQINTFMETFNEIEDNIEGESKVSLNAEITEEDFMKQLTPVIPKKGKFEVEDFREW